VVHAVERSGRFWNAPTTCCGCRGHGLRGVRSAPRTFVVELLDASCTLKSKHSVMVTSAPAMLAREINLGMHHSHVAGQCVVA
jgi:hypothetical protein